MLDTSVHASVAAAYLAQGRAALVRIIAFLGGECSADASLGQAFSAYEVLAQRLGGFQALGVRLGLPEGLAKQTVADCNVSLRAARTIEERGIEQASEMDALRLLRLLSQLEQLVENKPEVGVTIRLPEPDNAKLLRGQQQVRALELVIRGLINEAYGGEAQLTQELTAWVGSERIQQWRRVADPGNLLSGTSFSELIELFVSEKQYPRRYAPLYTSTPYLRMLNDQRKTLAMFLTDIRLIRNRIAHHKRVTAVQIALLDRYYDEVIAPVQQAYDDARVGVNPDSHFDATSAQLADYFGRVDQRLDRIGDDLLVVRDGIDAANEKLDAAHKKIDDLGGQVNVIDRWTDWAGQHMRYIIAGVGVVLALAILILYLTAKTSGAVQGSKKETSSNPRKELANRGIVWRSEELRSAIDNDDLESVGLFMEGGMKWRPSLGYKTFDKDNTAMIDLLLDHPDNLHVEQGDCSGLRSHLTRVEPGSRKDDDQGRSERAHQLSKGEKKLLALVCNQPDDVSAAKADAEQARRRYQEQVAAYEQALAQRPTAAQCKAELSANGYRELLTGVLSYNPLRGSPAGIGKLYQDLYIPVSSGQINEAQLRPAVAKYCDEQAQEAPNIDISEAYSLSKKQIYDALR